MATTIVLGMGAPKSDYLENHAFRFPKTPTDISDRRAPEPENPMQTVIRVHFGSAGASDFTQHRDPVRKRQYLARHAPREHWENPMTAGALARWILWNKETLPSSVEDYTRRFGLAAV